MRKKPKTHSEAIRSGFKRHSRDVWDMVKHPIKTGKEVVLGIHDFLSILSIMAAKRDLQRSQVLLSLAGEDTDNLQQVITASSAISEERIIYSFWQTIDSISTADNLELTENISYLFASLFTGGLIIKGWRKASNELKIYRYTHSEEPFLFKNRYNDSYGKPCQLCTRQEVTTTPGTYIYGVNKEKKFRIARRYQDKDGFIHHSKLFPETNELILAGEHIRGRRRIKTNNKSGHFRPRYEGVENDIRNVFLREGIDPGEVKLFFPYNSRLKKLFRHIKQTNKFISPKKLITHLETELPIDFVWHVARNRSRRILTPPIAEYVRKKFPHIDPVTGQFRNSYSPEEIKKFAFDWRQKNPYVKGSKFIDYLERKLGHEFVWEASENAFGKRLQKTVVLGTSFLFTTSLWSMNLENPEYVRPSLDRVSTSIDSSPQLTDELTEISTKLFDKQPQLVSDNLNVSLFHPKNNSAAIKRKFVEDYCAYLILRTGITTRDLSEKVGTTEDKVTLLKLTEVALKDQYPNTNYDTALTHFVHEYCQTIEKNTASKLESTFTMLLAEQQTFNLPELPEFPKLQYRSEQRQKIRQNLNVHAKRRQSPPRISPPPVAFSCGVKARLGASGGANNFEHLIKGVLGLFSVTVSFSFASACSIM